MARAAMVAWDELVRAKNHVVRERDVLRADLQRMTEQRDALREQAQGLAEKLDAVRKAAG